MVWWLAIGVYSRNLDIQSQLDENWGCSDNIVSSLSIIIKRLRWPDANIFYEAQGNEIVLNTLRYIEQDLVGFQTTVFDMTGISPPDTENMLRQIYQKKIKGVRIILFLSNTTLELLEIANTFDSRSNKTTNYRTSSSWIILSSSMFKRPFLDIQLRNIIVLTCYRDLVEHFTISDGKITTIDCLIHHHTPATGPKIENCSADLLFPNIKYRYSNHHVLIGTLESNFLQKHVDKYNNTVYSGVVVELSDMLAKHLNFTFTFVQPSDDKYGGKSSDGKWQGLVGLLVREEVDMVIADFSITEERSKIVDFILPPFTRNTWSALSNRGIQRESNWTKIFRPLNAYVYIAILATVVVVAILLLLVQTNSPEANCSHCLRPWNCVISILNNALFLISFVTARGDGVSTKKASVRVLVAFLSMFCIVLTGVYLGNLTAALTDTKYHKPFNSLEELVELPDWKWGIRGYSLSKKILKNSKNNVMMKIWKGLEEFNKTDPSIFDIDINVHVNRILTEGEKYVYFGFGAESQILNRNDCALQIVDSILSNFQTAIAVTKNSYLKPDLESAMAKLSDTGFLTMLDETIYKDNRPQHCKNRDTKRPLRLEDVLGAVSLASVGLATAIFVLIIEKCQQHNKLSLHQFNEYNFSIWR
ncbi:hypothetical protein SNE40_008421 [Patella caerulea]|uniref:Uncharacterized protein n=1 Tax=Patella caerulea TaxID=87958 RepID=A0AAN8QAD2_PATCE